MPNTLHASSFHNSLAPPLTSKALGANPDGVSSLDWGQSLLGFVFCVHLGLGFVKSVAHRWDPELLGRLPWNSTAGANLSKNSKSRDLS